MYVYIYTHRCIYIYIHMFICVCMCMYIYIDVYIYICAYVYVHVYVYGACGFSPFKSKFWFSVDNLYLGYWDPSHSPNFKVQSSSSSWCNRRRPYH